MNDIGKNGSPDEAKDVVVSNEFNASDADELAMTREIHPLASNAKEGDGISIDADKPKAIPQTGFRGAQKVNTFNQEMEAMKNLCDQISEIEEGSELPQAIRSQLQELISSDVDVKNIDLDENGRFTFANIFMKFAWLLEAKGLESEANELMKKYERLDEERQWANRSLATRIRHRFETFLRGLVLPC